MEKILSKHAFLTISDDFSQFHRKRKKSFSQDFRQERPYFVWISIKTWFTIDFCWFFPVSSKKSKVISFRLPIKWRNFYQNIFFSRFLMIFHSFIKKSKNQFLPISDRRDKILLESKFFSHDFWWFFSSFIKKFKKIISTRDMTELIKFSQFHQKS